MDCGDVSWEDLLDNPEDLSDCEPDSCAHVRVVLDVIDVLFSTSSVVTELCVMFLFVALIGNLWNRSLILKEARDERGRKIFDTFGSNNMSFPWRGGPDGTNTQEHHGDKIRRFLQEMDGGKQAWDSLRNR